jgi:hypothetical protein
MTWNAPITWTVGQTVTFSQLNSQIRDNMLETAPAKATASGFAAQFSSNGANAIAERLIKDAIVATLETTASTTYIDLTTSGPSVTVTTGAFAQVFTSCTMSNSGANDTRASFDITGATTSAPTDSRGVTAGAGNNIRATAAHLMALTPGSNVFKEMYRASAGTGSFSQRNLCVVSL